MRVLMVTPAYYPFVEKGGPAVKARALAEHLVRRGHAVTVLTVAYGSSAARTETIGGVEVIYLRPLASYRAATLNEGVTAFCRERLRHFELVHFFGLYDLLGPQVGRFCRKWSIPYVVEPLGMLRPRDRSLMLKRAWQTLLGQGWLAGAARIIVTSRAERAEALEFGYPEEKVKLRYNGLSLDEFAQVPAGAFRARLGIAPEEPLVLFLGRLIPRKGADLLMDAFAEAFPQKGRLVIAGPEGEPGQLKQLKARAQERSIHDRVLFPGALQGEDKVAALADADVFVLPSRYENFANAAAEAIACGTPVIISDRCGISELVYPQAGIVIPCEVGALTSALRHFFSSPGLRRRLEAGCRQLAERLDWAGLVIQQEGIYRDVLERRGSERTSERFYDAHPFDWVDAESPDAVSASIAPALRQLIDKTPPDSLIVDAGCGAGRVTQFLATRGFRCVGLDASARSVRIMADRCGRPGALADNRALPVKDGVADVVISDGVLHHTGDSFASFQENCRVLRAGGRMYVAIYKPGGRYQMLYRFPGGMIRWAVRNPALRRVVHATLLPLYFAVHLVKPRGTRTWRGARNLFYDYFVSPHVEFISREIVGDWCRRCGMTLCLYDSNPAGNTHGFVLEKQPTRAQATAVSEDGAPRAVMNQG
jgi:glycosyltransferase involved in cell wall biosynthesis/ubiquinone/menaquinone biosynthesis C-methylase UbiE